MGMTNGKMEGFYRKTEVSLKTKQCQPAASDTPDLIQTECVTDSGLACPKKLTEHKIYKN